MSLSDSLKASILAYLYEPTSLSDFRSKATPLALDAGESRDPEALRIANQILGDFADLDLGHMSEKDLKQNLRNLLFGQSASKYLELPFDPFIPQPATSTGTSTTEGAASFELVGTGRALVFG
jgi:hypothetical protein